MRVSTRPSERCASGETGGPGCIHRVVACALGPLRPDVCRSRQQRLQCCCGSPASQRRIVKRTKGTLVASHGRVFKATIAALLAIASAATAAPVPGDESGLVSDDQPETSTNGDRRGALWVPKKLFQLIALPFRGFVFVYDRYQLNDWYYRIFYTRDRRSRSCRSSSTGPASASPPACASRTATRSARRST